MKYEDVDLEAAAEEIAERIKRNIVNAPGERWNRSGELLRSIRAVAAPDGSAGVVAAPDRLDRQEVADRFFDEIVPVDLDETARKAIADAVHESIVVEDVEI